MQQSIEGPHATAILARIEAWWSDWRERRRLGDELAGFGADELERIAHDVGAATGEQLLAVAAAGPNGAALMGDLATALGLDIGELQARHPEVLRQMQICCATCTCKAECAHDLAEGTAAERHTAYCPNAETLAALTS